MWVIRAAIASAVSAVYGWLRRAQYCCQAGNCGINQPCSLSNSYPHPAAEILHDLFHLPAFVVLDSDYSCAVLDGILWHGRLYVTSDAVCFYSNILSRETRHVIPYNIIYAVHKRATALFIPALEIVVGSAGGPTPTERRLLFSSFAVGSRDAAYTAIQRRLHESHAGSATGVRGPEFKVTGPRRVRRPVGSVDGAVAHQHDAPGTVHQEVHRHGKTTTYNDEGDVVGAVAASSQRSTPSAFGSEARPTRAVSDVGVAVGLLQDEFQADGTSRGPLRTLGDSLLLPIPPGGAIGVVRQRSHSLSSVTGAGAPPAASSSVPHQLPPSGALDGLRAPVLTSATTADGATLLGRQVPHAPTSTSTVLQGAASTASHTTDEQAGVRRTSRMREDTALLKPPPHALMHRLASMKLVVDAVLPISADDFHDAFIGDAASILSAPAYHARRGETAITATRWADAVVTGDSDDEPLVTRTLRMRMPIISSMPGAPVDTAIEKQQRCAYYAKPIMRSRATSQPAAGIDSAQHMRNKRVLVLQTAARAADIPFGTCESSSPLLPAV